MLRFLLPGLRTKLGLNTIRRYATHRDLREPLRFRHSGSGGFWKKWRVPILFAGGVVAFDYFILPQAFKVPGIGSTLRRNPELVVYGLMGLNALGFLAWRAPFSARIMARYGLLQKDPRYFNIWQMFGSAFSHQEFWHLAVNMFVLYQFGVPVARMMGAAGFTESYLDACVLSSLGSMLFPALLGQAGWGASLGASGAVFSVLGTFSWLLPHARLAFWFIPLPFGAWWVFLLTLGYNGLAMIGKTSRLGGLDYAGHVAGSLVGVAYGYVVQERARSRRRSQMRSW